ncbi:heme A synthase [Virgibacillus soli]|uniref:Heme A synthase n=1 Tax=Paracerasibacillus soli TaxID=480284 RepID=A0ABU5CQI3_9BACI|nr:heme A synthase [Virgibacillus soli]MDY0408072.1 heme A synthase [Virgibacillus soli]
MKTLKRLSIISTLIMVFILIGGALVTKTESGDGCGSSWPLCHGQFVPTEITPALVIELSHRVISGVGGIIILLLSFLAWRRIGHIREVKFLSFLSIFFLVLQGLIGAAAVKWGQSDFVLAIHFGVSLISFAAVFLLTLLIFEIDKKLDTKDVYFKKRHRIEIFALTFYTLIVVYTGALVRHADANLVCKDWPFCNNSAPFAILDYRFDQWIQMGHRLFAGILFIWTISFCIRLIKQYKSNQVVFWGSVTLLSLISLQVFFGALIIFTMLNLFVALLHALVITCYFGVLCYFILLASRSKVKEKAHDPNIDTELVYVES